MREILFRGKRLDNGEWVEGWSCKYPFGRWPLNAAMIPSQDAENGHFEFVEVDPSTVGQYTGLTDKNGQRIFEGDVMDFCAYGLYYRGEVSFVDGSFCVLCNIPTASPFLDSAIKSHNAVCVGNIHDNLELLGGADNG